VKLPHAHRQYLPPPEPVAGPGLAEWLLAAAILALFVVIFVAPVVLRWHG
jgi:hypothetical protein